MEVQQHITYRTKIKVYEAQVNPVFTHGCECWTLKKCDEMKMSVIEIGWLKRILGVSRFQKLRNEFIWNKLGQDETLCSKIQKKRLWWFEHVERMEEHRLPQRVLHCFIEGKRSRGRQANTWMDKIKEDLITKNLYIRTATDLIRDRTRWRTLVQIHRQPSLWKGEKKKKKKQTLTIIN